MRHDVDDYRDDWIEVVYQDDGGGYDWSIFWMYYSPSARRYFWDSQGGCSCNWWEDPGQAGWEDGDRRAAMTAARDWGVDTEDIRRIAMFNQQAAVA